MLALHALAPVTTREVLPEAPGFEKPRFNPLGRRAAQTPEEAGIARAQSHAAVPWAKTFLSNTHQSGSPRTVPIHRECPPQAYTKPIPFFSMKSQKGTWGLGKPAVAANDGCEFTSRELPNPAGSSFNLAFGMLRPLTETSFGVAAGTIICIYSLGK